MVLDILSKKAVFKAYMKLVVLKTLGDRPRHAYGIIKELEDLTGIRPSTGAVYPILKKLEREGLISVEAHPSQLGRSVKIYKITEKGLNYLNTHSEELKEALNVVASIKKLKAAGCDKLLRIIRELATSASSLSDEDLMELRKAVAEFEVKILNIMSSRKR